jgi:hypothetical protein
MNPSRSERTAMRVINRTALCRILIAGVAARVCTRQVVTSMAPRERVTSLWGRPSRILEFCMRRNRSTRKPNSF